LASGNAGARRAAPIEGRDRATVRNRKPIKATALTHLQVPPVYRSVVESDNGLKGLPYDRRKDDTTDRSGVPDTHQGFGEVA